MAGKFQLLFTPQAQADLTGLANDPSAAKRLKAARKALGLLETNPRHPGLRTHEYSRLRGPKNQKVFEAYCENRTPAAYRIFFCYGPNPDQITIVAITPHP